MTKMKLFEELARPDENGYSRWVNKNEFVGRYSSLMFRNGADWCRAGTSIHKKYIIKFDKTVSPGPSIDRIKLAGFRRDQANMTQSIRADIKKFYKSQRCVVLGTSHPEVDHKNGWKNDQMVMNVSTQRFEDFQPLSRAANDAKRQFCKECRHSHIRYDAKKLGYPISFYKGNMYHDGSTTGCEGCFWYDPIEFRKHLEEKRK